MPARLSTQQHCATRHRSSVWLSSAPAGAEVTREGHRGPKQCSTSARAWLLPEAARSSRQCKSWRKRVDPRCRGPAGASDHGLCSGQLLLVRCHRASVPPNPPMAGQGHDCCPVLVPHKRERSSPVASIKRKPQLPPTRRKAAWATGGGNCTVSMGRWQLAIPPQHPLQPPSAKGKRKLKQETCCQAGQLSRELAPSRVLPRSHQQVQWQWLKKRRALPAEVATTQQSQQEEARHCSRDRH
mmetsp:Transcript_62958/g.174512  ORF Transcript_62958/g.174512 Transcript_62958/m.174512 type:complete len:241 (-) Transcript_62958:295-1017(-)